MVIPAQLRRSLCWQLDFFYYSEIICTLRLYLHLGMIYLSSAFQVADITKHRVCVHNSWHIVYKECKSTYDAYMHLKEYENHFYMHICYASLRIGKILDSYSEVCVYMCNIYPINNVHSSVFVVFCYGWVLTGKPLIYHSELEYNTGAIIWLLHCHSECPSTSDNC